METSRNPSFAFLTHCHRHGNIHQFLVTCGENQTLHVHTTNKCDLVYYINNVMYR